MRKLIYLLVFIGLFTSCKSPLNVKGKKNRIVLISTEYGDMKVHLYDETPLHRNNFIKLTKDEFFDGILFHRVIKNFMIQGGDPDSRDAKPNERLGKGGPGYKLPAELNPNLFHKKGVLAAAREGDAVNPEKKSSGSQFYIVQGRVYTPEKLESEIKKINRQKRIAISNRIRKENSTRLTKLRSERDMIKMSELIQNIEKTIDSLALKEKMVLSEEQKKIYTTIGGTPHLDGAYTVFGEVVEGIEIIDKIAEVQTNIADRPIKDLEMTITILK